MGSDAKSKTSKRPHEDEGDVQERDEGAHVQPLDVLAMEQLLESMGADKFEPRVVAQLQEFVHRTSVISSVISSTLNSKLLCSVGAGHVTEILVDAQEYSMYADKQVQDQRS
jgi:hypothetical protein